MSERYTFTVEVYTDALVITGSYDLPLYRRVCDAVNNRLHRFVTLRDASVAPLWRPQQVERVPQLLVDWGSAFLIATLAEPSPPPDFHVPALPRDTQPTMFFTSIFALRADFFKRSDMELIVMLNEMTDDFVSLSGATIYPLHGGAPFNRGFVCLNRHRIQVLYAVGASVAHAQPPSSEPAAVASSPAATASTPAEAESSSETIETTIPDNTDQS